MTLKPNTPIKTLNDGGLTPLPMENDATIDGFITNILSNQDTLVSLTENATEKLERYTKAIETGNADIIAQELSSFENIDLSKELVKIKELDEIIKLKTVASDNLTRDRINRSRETSGQATPLSSEGSDIFELKSWHSHDHQTFLTEPKLVNLSRKPVGKQHLAQVTSYKQNDFIERNKALGPSARYFDALTKDEQERIDIIIANEDLFANVDIDEDGFMPSKDEVEALRTIDTKLSEIVPEEEWIPKSIIWTPVASGTQTPMTWDRSQLSTGKSRQLNEILADVTLKQPDIYLEDRPRLMMVDSKLDLLVKEPRPIEQDDIIRLLDEIKLEIRQEITAANNA